MENDKEFEYVFVKKDKGENAAFLFYLENATKNLKKAMLEIEYWKFPKVNKDLVLQLNEIIREINRMNYCVSEECYVILKPKIKEED